MGSSPHFPHERFYCIPTVTHRKSDDIIEANERLIEAADVEAQQLREGRLRAQVILGRARRAASRLQEKTNMAAPVQRVPAGTVVEADRMAKDAISPKAILALVLPAIGTLVLALVNEFVTVHMDTTLKIAVVGAVNALLAALGAYVGKPGEVVVGTTVR